MGNISIEIRSRLRGELITLYPDVGRALLIINDIGMPNDKLTINSNISVLWASILNEAEKHDKINDIIEIALEEYPDRNILREVLLEINEEENIQHENLKDQWVKIRRLIDSEELSASIDKAEDFIQSIQSYVQTELKEIRSDFEELNSQNASLEDFKKEKSILLNRLNNTLFEKLNDRYFSEKPAFKESLRKVQKGSVQVELEKIVGQSPYKNNQVSMAWLSKGYRASRSVVLVKQSNGSMGTGFILNGGFLLTANYVISNKSEAEKAVVEAVYGTGDGSKNSSIVQFKLDTSIFYSASIKDNNYSLVKIIDEPLHPIQDYGFLELEAIVDLLPGDKISIIQHPHGGKKQLSYSDNSIIEINDAELVYQASTFPGSGGAPLLNQDWKVIGMHLKKVASSPGEFHANIKAGVSIKTIINDLKSKIPKEEIESFPFLNNTIQNIRS